MKGIIILSVFLVLLSLTQGQDKVPPPEPKPETSPKPTDAPTEPPKTTAAPTAAPTAPPPTVPPTTPSVPPTTPSVPPTTTSVPPTTTSVPPTTPSVPTTQAPITPTTAAPTPKPAAEGTWALTYPNSNITCIILKMQLHLEVPYMSVEDKMLNATIPVLSTAEAIGTCVNEDLQNITLVWNEKNSIKFMFERNVTSKQFMLSAITVAITPDSASFPNRTSNATIINAELYTPEFITPLAMSYRCNKEESLKIPLIENQNKSMTFVVSKLQLEAFRNATGMSFSSAEDCEPSETPGIVPIAVGCSLAALIILVLIAYLVGRRRSQARGYLSM